MNVYSPVADSDIFAKVRLCCGKMVLVYYGYFQTDQDMWSAYWNIFPICWCC